MESHSPNSTTRSLGVVRRSRARTVPPPADRSSKLSGATVRMKKGTCRAAANALSCVARVVQRAANATAAESRNASAMQSSSSPGLAGGQGDSLASWRSCSADAVDSALISCSLARVCQFLLEVPNRARDELEVLRLPSAGCRGRRPGRRRERRTHWDRECAIARRRRSGAHVGEQHGERAQPAPADGCVVDPQYGDVAALVVRAGQRATSMSRRRGRSWGFRAS